MSAIHIIQIQSTCTCSGNNATMTPILCKSMWCQDWQLILHLLAYRTSNTRLHGSYLDAIFSVDTTQPNMDFLWLFHPITQHWALTRQPLDLKNHHRPSLFRFKWTMAPFQNADSLYLLYLQKKYTLSAFECDDWWCAWWFGIRKDFLFQRWVQMGPIELANQNQQARS